MSGRKCMLNERGVACEPTLIPSRLFNPEEDAKVLRKAMKGMGTDEDAVISILAKRSWNQRLEIGEKFETMFGMSLKKCIHKETSGHFRKILTVLVMDEYMYYARVLYKAMKGAGTDEKAIIEVLCPASNDEIEEIKAAYGRLLDECGIKDPSRNLLTDLKSDLGGDFKRFMMALVQARREEFTVDELENLSRNNFLNDLCADKIKEDFLQLYDPESDSLSRDEDVYIKIFASRSRWHLLMLSNYYEAKLRRRLLDDLDSAQSGDFKRALKMILGICTDPTKVYADLIRKSVHGAGTDDSTLIRVIVCRSEIDLKDIDARMTAEYGYTLEDCIRGDTSGYYRQTLLTLAGINCDN